MNLVKKSEVSSNKVIYIEMSQRNLNRLTYREIGQKIVSLKSQSCNLLWKAFGRFPD